MPRLFAGLEIPATVRDELAKIRQPLPGARWIEPENFHLTLRFFGDVDKPAAREIDDALSRIALEAFEITISGLGTFGGNEPRSIWAGVTPNPALDMLAAACERAARIAGLPPERRSFKPHVTLARLKNPRIEPIARFLGRHGGFKSEPLPVSEFVLFSSKPKTGGGPYVSEAAYPLASHDWTDEDDARYAPANGENRW